MELNQINKYINNNLLKEFSLNTLCNNLLLPTVFTILLRVLINLHVFLKNIQASGLNTYGLTSNANKNYESRIQSNNEKLK